LGFGLWRQAFAVGLVVAVPAAQGVVAGVREKEFQGRRFNVAGAKRAERGSVTRSNFARQKVFTASERVLNVWTLLRLTEPRSGTSRREVVAVPAAQGIVAGVRKKKFQGWRFDVAVAKYQRKKNQAACLRLATSFFSSAKALPSLNFKGIGQGISRISAIISG
jgi:hypothetical protein